MVEEVEPLSALNFVPVTARQTWENLPLVIAGGLVFAVACLPAAVLAFLGLASLALVVAALLVSPAWAVLVDLLGDVAVERSASLRRMPRAFARLWMPSVRLSLLFVIPLFAARLIAPAFRQEHVSSAMWLALFANLLALAVACSIALYAYPLLADHDLGALVAPRNGAILSSRHAMNTVGLVSMAALGMFAVGKIGIVLLFVLPGLYGMFVVNNYRLVMQAKLDT